MRLLTILLMQACMFLLSAHSRSFLSSFFSNIIDINLFFIFIIIIIIMMIIFYLLSLFARVRWKSIRLQSDWNRINFQGASFCPKIASFASHLFFFFSLFVNYRIVLVLPSLSLCFSIEVKAKSYRSQSEVLSKSKRR